MPLHLRIDNMDSLPDGGPVSYELDRRGIDIGRDPYLDWTLPDPERLISGKHCEIRYRDGGYWLHDVSTNGTTVNGRPGRLTEPHRLQDGDRLNIGHYIVAVELTGADAAPPPREAAPPFGGNVWDNVPDAAAAVDRRDFAARSRAGSGGDQRGPADLPEEDISWSIGEVTRDAPPEDVWETPGADGEPASGGADWGWTPPPSAGAPESGGAPTPRGRAPGSQGELSPEVADAAPPPDTGPPSSGAERVPPATATPVSGDPFDVSEAAPATAKPAEARSPENADADAGAAPVTARPVAPDAAPRTEAAPQIGEPQADGPASELAGQWTAGAAAEPAGARTTASAGGFVAAFERGAGLPPGAVAGRADEAFAEELGALFKLVAQHLQAMLHARAETKSAMRSSERTMINAFENNPLKFSPSPEEALRIMFGAKSRSYLDARATVEASFGDLQRHQVQTFGAMQQALQALIEDLDPKKIEEATAEDGGLAALVGSRRAKFWDTYAERFRAKSGRHERGMIDAFMVLFAEMYDRQR